VTPTRPRVDFDAVTRSWRLTWSGWELAIGLTGGRLLARLCAAPGTALDTDLPAVPNHLGHPAFERNSGLDVVETAQGQLRFELAEWRHVDETDGVTLEIDLEAGAVQLRSRWQVDAVNDVVTHAAELTNGGATSCVLAQADSVALLLPEATSTTFLTGQWIRETQRCTAAAAAPLLLESRSGKTGFEHAPYLAVHGRGYTAALLLAWSGNWFLRTVPEPATSRDRVPMLVRAGLHPGDLRHELRPSESLPLPVVRLALSTDGLDAVTQRLHRHRRARLAHRRVPPPVQFNSWYPHQERPTLRDMSSLAEHAGALGCEVFVQDAGWYANLGTNGHGDDWWACVGDWATATDRFPGGMAALADRVRALGMQFGLWFEPEAVASDSQLARQHPDWMHATASAGPGRRIADLGQEAVRAHLAEVIGAVLSEAGATWMKWDYNLNLVPDVSGAAGPDPVVAHVLGVYDLQERLLRTMPGLALEMCAGGGGRFDDAVVERAHTNWMSDQTQPLANLSIHFGSQLLHLPEECNDWLVDWPPHDTHAGLTPVDTRGDLHLRAAVGMLGSFGISAPLDRWSAQERAEVAGHVAWFKERIRPLFANADQYLLGAQPSLEGDGDWAGVWYVTPDGARGHLSTFRLADASRSWEPALAGLDPERTYAITSSIGASATLTGRELAEGALTTESAPFGAALFDVVAVS
jgi:alpha-galactosidase